MPMLMVICGAEASYDSSPDQPTNGFNESILIGAFADVTKEQMRLEPIGTSARDEGNERR